MISMQGGLDSPLINESNSQGIIQDSVPVQVPLPEQVLSSTQQTKDTSSEGLPPLELESQSLYSFQEGITDSFGAETSQAQRSFERFANTSTFDSVLATAGNWDFMGVIYQAKIKERIRDNEAGLYTPDPNYSLKDSIESTHLPLTKEEVEWLNGKDITSQGAFNLYIENIEEARERNITASASPVASTLMGFVDPTYIPLGLGVGKAAQVARVGRFGTAGVVGASEYAMVEAQSYHRPVDNVERVVGAVLPTAITLGLYKPNVSKASLNGSKTVGDSYTVGKAKIATPEYESGTKATVKSGAVETLDYIDNIDAINASRNVPLGKNAELLMPEVKVDATGLDIPPKLNKAGLPASSEINWSKTNSKGTPYSKTAYKWAYDVIEDARLPKSVRDATQRLLMQGGKDLLEMPVELVKKMKQAGRYYPKKNEIKLKGKAKTGAELAQTFNHEVAHGLTAIKVHFGKANPNTVHGQIVKDIDALREHAIKEYKATKDSYTMRERQEIEYATKDTDEFIAGLYEGDTAFKRLMSNTVPDTLKNNTEKTLLQSLYTGMRKLLGFTTEEATAYNKAMGLSNDLIDAPKIQYTDLQGNIKEFNASEVTPKLINEVSSAEAQEVFKQTLGQKIGNKLSWNLYETIAGISPEWVKKILSNPTAGEMTSNVVSSKRALATRLGLKRIDAEQAIHKELSNRGVSIVDRAFATEKYRTALWQLEGEVAYYVEQRSQAGKRGITLPDGNDAVAKIAKLYNEMTQEAKAVGIRYNVFAEEVGDVNWYLPRKIDPDNFMTQLRRFRNLFGEEEATNRMIDNIAKSIVLEGGDQAYRRHIAYIYYRRMNDRYNATTDNFRGHMGNELIGEIKGYLEEIGVTDELSRNHVERILSGAIDKRGEASFQKARLDINTLEEIPLPDGTTFRFYDLMDHRVIDPYSRYADNVAGRVALSEQGLGTPTLWNAYKAEFMNDPKLDGKPQMRQQYSDLIDNIYNDILGYPVGEKLHPFLVATRAFTQSVALKFSGIWQPMEAIPTLRRHAKANGIASTFSIAGKSLFQSVKALEKSKANDLVNILVRGSMDDLKVSPMSARLADNFDLNTNTFSAKMNHLSQYTHIVNGMRYLMGKQSIMSANLIVDNIEKAVKGEAGSIRLLKAYGFDDTNLKTMKKEMDLHGTDFSKWDIDSKGDLLPKLMNLMDTDVLRSRLGEIPAIAQFSQVGKVLMTFRNFILSSHNKIFASTLKDEGMLAVAMLTAYQLPIAMLSVQVASIAKGEGIEDDPAKLLQKAIAQLGGLGLLPEVMGILSGETRSFGSPFMLGLDRALAVGNAVGSGDPLKMTEALGSVIPVASVTLGFQLGLESVLSTLREDEIKK